MLLGSPLALSLFNVFLSHSTGVVTDPDWVREGGYVRVTNSDLYYHYQSGYYYESVRG